ncbi:MULTISPECIES: hypothetical protein [Virgibacillus]|uniref:Uncharacterized protein n=2 Tax=Virgibacillus TaxID=84406 RepID=A0A024QDW9_9BACI|nr:MULTISPECIES: hypothetical protein [Virgibacillus]EQB36682.1 hypothetical protein M948_16755 [Virgibacillus sp. CM-4]MYL42508.1 hypothetical protein [Virgibacillus massiliensis]GGJ74620.1 hypothetical protein GCM10007111_40180 [Virgibacillus kapii]CDQ40390.1 hypothetical protein BN990_02712 [Virgibacillus massiliensis]
MLIATSGSGGGGAQINVHPDEITTIYNQLQAIIAELESSVTPNIQKLGEIDYYQAGKAKPAMEVYAEANEKLMDLYDNYVRASTLVIDVLNTMIETDQAIAEQIIAKLEV